MFKSTGIGKGCARLPYNSFRGPHVPPSQWHVTHEWSGVSLSNCCLFPAKRALLHTFPHIPAGMLGKNICPDCPASPPCPSTLYTSPLECSPLVHPPKHPNFAPQVFWNSKEERATTPAKTRVELGNEGFPSFPWSISKSWHPMAARPWTSTVLCGSFLQLKPRAKI